MLESLRLVLPQVRAFRGVLYRACDPAWANSRDLLTGDGSRAHGGRWNSPGSFAAIYLSQKFEGAIAEVLGLSGHYGFDPSARLPLTLVAIDAALESVLDLAEARVRKMTRLTLKLMTSCDWRQENTAGREAVAQALGRAAFDLGIQGIIVPSAVKRSLRNLIVFPANLGKSCHLRISKADRLPPPPPRGVL
jgi:RES domain-containing protein